MGNYESLAILAMIALLVYIFDRKNFTREGIVFLRRTKKGLQLIDSIAGKYPRAISFLADLGIVFSFGLMGLRYLFMEKKLSGSRRVRYYLAYLLIFAALFIYRISPLYNVFFLGIADAYNLPPAFADPVISVLLAASFLFGVSGYGFVTLFFGAITFSGAIKLVLPIDLSGGAAGSGGESAVPVFYVPITEWLISILFILVVHEFSHAIVSRTEGIKVKSLGYGFFGPLPLGFAEPDEKEIKRSASLTKTRIFGAGSFSNVLAALLVIIIYTLALTAGISSGAIALTESGVYIRSVEPGMPASVLPDGTLITAIDGTNITSVKEFVQLMAAKGPGDSVTILVNGTEYNLTLVEDPDNRTRGIIGIVVAQERVLQEGTFIDSLVRWLIILNVGIALANLFPLRPLDGGLMLEEVIAGAGIKKQERRRTADAISKITLFLLLFSLLTPWLLSMFA